MLADLVRTDRHQHRPVAADRTLAEAVKVLAPAASQTLLFAASAHHRWGIRWRADADSGGSSRRLGRTASAQGLRRAGICCKVAISI
jgi:hypothetical protein